MHEDIIICICRDSLNISQALSMKLLDILINLSNSFLCNFCSVVFTNLFKSFILLIGRIRSILLMSFNNSFDFLINTFARVLKDGRNTILTLLNKSLRFQIVLIIDSHDRLVKDLINSWLQPIETDFLSFSKRSGDRLFTILLQRTLFAFNGGGNRF